MSIIINNKTIFKSMDSLCFRLVEAYSTLYKKNDFSDFILYVWLFRRGYFKNITSIEESQMMMNIKRRILEWFEVYSQTGDSFDYFKSPYFLTGYINEVAELKLKFEKGTNGFDVDSNPIANYYFPTKKLTNFDILSKYIEEIVTNRFMPMSFDIFVDRVICHLYFKNNNFLNNKCKVEDFDTLNLKNLKFEKLYILDPNDLTISNNEFIYQNLLPNNMRAIFGDYCVQITDKTLDLKNGQDVSIIKFTTTEGLLLNQYLYTKNSIWNIFLSTRDLILTCWFIESIEYNLNKSDLHVEFTNCTKINSNSEGNVELVAKRNKIGTFVISKQEAVLKQPFKNLEFKDDKIILDLGFWRKEIIFANGEGMVSVK